VLVGEGGSICCVPGTMTTVVIVTSGRMFGREGVIIPRDVDDDGIALLRPSHDVGAADVLLDPHDADTADVLLDPHDVDAGALLLPPHDVDAAAVLLDPHDVDGGALLFPPHDLEPVFDENEGLPTENEVGRLH
jgi:hypothetical protein